MDNNTRTPIELLTDMLAAMTERAVAAEKERDEVKARSLDWYKSWERVDKAHKETQAALAEEIREHQKTKAELEEAIHAVDVLNDELVRITKKEPVAKADASPESVARSHESV